MALPIQIAIDCADPEPLATFWAQALHYEVAAPPGGHETWAAFSEAEDVPGEAWCRVVDPEGLGPPILFHRVPEPKITKNRVHLDIGPRPRDPDETAEARAARRESEIRRLVALGATHVRTNEDREFAVMQDPEGNEFCT